jgi:thioredoxin 1
MGLTVVALCANWCGLCRDFKLQFKSLAQSHAHDCFLWVDIEDASVWQDEIEIETFPTLLVLNEKYSPVFFGPVLPQELKLKRLLLEAREGQISNWPLVLSSFIDRLADVGTHLSSESNFIEL